MAERAAGSRAAATWVPIAAVVSSMAAGLATAINPIAGLAFLAPIAAALVLLSPVVAVPLLIVASTINRVGVSWGDAQIRIEIVVVLLLAVVVANQLAVRTLPARALRSPILAPLILYLLANVAATLLFAVERTRGLKLDAEIVAAVATYVVASALFWRRDALRLAVRVLWIVTPIEAAIGVLAMVFFAAHVSSYGIQINEGGFPMAYGTQWEANIFGSFLLGNFLVLLGDYVNNHRRGLYTFALFIVVLGIGVSMTRTVWLALIVSIVLFALLTRRARRTTSLARIVLAIPVVVLLGLIVGSATPLAGRLLGLLDLQSSSASGRFVWFSVALQEWKSHPILGNGTGSFNYNPVSGQPHPWLPNLFLLTLHDTGIIGLLALLAVIVLFYRAALRGIRPENDQGVLVAGATAGFTGLLLAFQMTTGFWFAYPWIVAAIAIRGSRARAEEL